MAKDPEETWAETMAIIAKHQGDQPGADTLPANLALMRYGELRAAEARELLTREQTEEFLIRLEGPEGCDFKEDSTWRCAGGKDLSYSRAILTAMGVSEGVREGFLGCVTALGGHCDCEVLFNAADRLFEGGWWKREESDAAE